jgi:hypothetical protein
LHQLAHGVEEELLFGRVLEIHASSGGRLRRRPFRNAAPHCTMPHRARLA